MKDNEEKLPKVNISWYPGHMAKTKKQIIQDLKLIDVVIEILDARIPVSSHNPDIANIIKNKKKLVLLNKCDLADKNENKKWVEYFRSQGVSSVLVDCNLGKGVNETIIKIKELMKEEQERQIQKGKIGNKIRVLVLGIPNVGKSSYINRVTKKTSAKVGNKPGVTVQKQWIKLDNSIELLDTPGVLWPKLDTQEIALNLSFTGTIKDEILEKTELAYELLKILLNEYSENIMQRYKLESLETNTDNPTLEIMEKIGQKRGAIVSGGRISLEKTANIILDDFRTGKIGQITLEKIN